MAGRRAHRIQELWKLLREGLFLCTVVYLFYKWQEKCLFFKQYDATKSGRYGGGGEYEVQASLMTFFAVPSID